MMKRDECLKVLAQHIPDDLVVSAYSTAFDWIAIRPDHPMNFTSVGAMGLASSHGLGFALSRPDRRIIVLDGDGSLLMNLGSLVSIANAAPRNLIHFVNQNGTYEANGGHPIPGRSLIDFAGMAAKAGYRRTYSFSDLDDFRARIAGVLREEGPVFVDLNVVPGAPSPRDYGVLYAAEKRDALRVELARSDPRPR